MIENKRSHLSSSRASSINSSKVLLVCIYDTIIIQITNQMVYNTFISYGKIQRILIFERGEITKCFVQFKKQQQCQSIKKNLDGSKIINTFCKMHIFFSSLSQIDLKNKNTRGVDYSSISTQKNYFYFIDSPKKDRHTQDDFGLYSKLDTTCDYDIYKSKTDDDQLMKCINKMRLQNSIQKEFILDQKIRWDIENILQDPQHDDNLERKRVGESNYNQNGKNCNMIRIEKQFQSEIVSFEYKNKITPTQIYNLFSNFGNIERILLKNFKAYIQFQNLNYAKIAKQYLNNTIIFDNLIIIHFSHQSQLILIPKQYSQSIIYDTSFHRFNINHSISLNPPSQFLHISNLKKQILNPEKIKDLFYDIAKIQKIKFLSTNKQRNMAIIKLYTLEDSFKAIATMHNKIVCGRKIQISFTKSKI